MFLMLLKHPLELTALFLMLLSDAYDEDEMNGEKEVVLKFKPNMAPIKAAVFHCLKTSRSWSIKPKKFSRK